MSRKRPVLDAVRRWILSQPEGSVFTPTEAAQACFRDGVKASSGATCMVLKELRKEGRVNCIHDLGSYAPRGAYKLLPAPKVGQAIVRPLIPATGTPEAPEHVLKAVEAIHEIQSGLDKLAAALLLPYTPKKAEVPA